jgi:hypothetical protein
MTARQISWPPSNRAPNAADSAVDRSAHCGADEEYTDRRQERLRQATRLSDKLPPSVTVRTLAGILCVRDDVSVSFNNRLSVRISVT